MRDDQQRLYDIAEAIDRIEVYTARGRGAFEQDELVRVWVVHHLQIIGEASRKLSDAVRSQHPEVPWAQIMAMRNVLVHDYFHVDPDAVWTAVARDLPELKAKVQAILDRMRKAT